MWDDLSWSPTEHGTTLDHYRAHDKAPGQLVSGSTRKEFGSCHSILTASEKLNRLKKSTTLLRCIREVTTLLSLSLERITIYRSRNRSGASVGIGTRGGKPDLGLTSCWRPSVDKPESEKLQGGPGHRVSASILWDFPPTAPPGSHSKYQRKTPRSFLQGVGTRNHFEHIVLLCS